MQEKITISVIIASWDDSRKENVAKLLFDIANQKIDADVQICRVEEVSPSGRARNIGADKAKGDYLVFVDDDIRIPDAEALAKLIRPLQEARDIAATFSSLLIPADSTAFQRQYAKEIPRSQIPVVEKQIDAGAFSTHFCAIRKADFNKVGGFNEYLKRGEDPEISRRLKTAGFRLVLAAQVFCYHPVPKNLVELIKLHFRNGIGVAFADRFYPSLNIDVNPESIINPVTEKTKRARIIRFTSQFIISIFSAKLLWTLSKISYIFGYAYGLTKRQDE